MLFGDLELSGIKNFSVMVSQLIDIYSAAIFVEVYRRFCRDVLLFINHLSEKIKDLHVITLVRTSLKIESDK